MNDKASTTDSLTADTLFESIRSQARHPKTRTAIENIKAACDFLDSQRISITIAAVGKQTENYKGGPTTPSIRNNEKFVDYIAARNRAQRLPALTDREVVEHRTGNPETDAYIFALEVELKAARKEIAALRSSFADAGEYDYPASLEQRRLILAGLPAGKLPPNPSIVAEKELVPVLEKLLNKMHLEPFGLVLDQGRIKSPERNMRVFLEKSEIAILENEIRRIRNATGLLDN